MKSLAIEREFGSGGREIGMQVAELAGIPYYDSNLLSEVAGKSGLSIGMLMDYDEKWTGSLLYNIYMSTDYTQSGSQKDLYKMYYELGETIKNLDRQGPAVFIGRSSTAILQDNLHVLKVFIYSSDREKRIRRIVETEQVPESEAGRLMEKKDKARKNYFKFWTQRDWSDRANYDMELNSATLSAKECADILLRAMEA